jgi:hypothetical protein
MQSTTIDDVILNKPNDGKKLDESKKINQSEINAISKLLPFIEFNISWDMISNNEDHPITATKENDKLLGGKEYLKLTLNRGYKLNITFNTKDIDESENIKLVYFRLKSDAEPLVNYIFQFNVDNYDILLAES